MRAAFRGHYPPSREELSSLWNEGLIVLDTNVLLNMYRYTQETRESLLTILSEFSERLWLPHQVAHEYQQRRLTTISEQRRAYKDLSKSVTSNIATLKGEVNKYRRHPVLEIDDLTSAIDKLHGSLLEMISTQESRHAEVATFTLHQDDVRDRLTTLFEGRVGSAYKVEQLDEIKQQGEIRYAKEIPPGYEDRKKPEDMKFGDLILWLQLLDHVQQEQCPVILVTEDAKKDWWLQYEGQIIGPHPELIAEMQNRTGQLLHMYRAEQFVRHARNHSQTSISDTVLNEIDHLAEKQQEERLVVDNASNVLKARHAYLTRREAILRREIYEHTTARDRARERYTATTVEIDGRRVDESQLIIALEAHKTQRDRIFAKLKVAGGTVSNDTTHDELQRLLGELERTDHQKFAAIRRGIQMSTVEAEHHERQMAEADAHINDATEELTLIKTQIEDLIQDQSS